MKEPNNGMQVELAFQGDVAGPVDTSSPNVLIEKELFALKAFVARYRKSLECVVKKTDIAIIVVPNVNAENPTIPENERTLGSDVDSVIRKVFALNRLEEAYLATKAIFVGVQNLAGQFSILNRMAATKPALRAVLKELQTMRGVVSLHTYIFTHATAKYILQLYDNIMRVNEKNQQGLGKAVGDTKPSPSDFPELRNSLVPDEVHDNALKMFDELSTSLPQDNIFREGKNKSKGGWRIWGSNQEGVYVAILYSLTTMEITSKRVVDAVVDVFAKKGIKARAQSDTKEGKYVVTIAFNAQQLQELNIAELKQLLAAEIKAFTFQKGASYVGGPLHSAAKTTSTANNAKPAAPNSNNTPVPKK